MATIGQIMADENYRLPQILVLQIKRFSYGKFSKQKLSNRVKVPTTLNLAKVIDSTIGGHKRRGLSGGEKKRVSIGVDYTARHVSHRVQTTGDVTCRSRCSAYVSMRGRSLAKSCRGVRTVVATWR